MDLYIPIYDYESNGRTYELSLSEYSINYFGDSKEVKFPIHMRDKKTNMVLFDVYYKYRTNSKDLYRIIMK